MKNPEKSLAEENPSVKKIPLGRGHFAIVDSFDFERVSRFEWHPQVHKTGTIYAQRSGKKGHDSMHRFLMRSKKDEEVDHIDGNGLNNTRINLRPANKSQQKMNMKITKASTTGFKGVHLVKRLGRWSSGITLNYTRIHLGYFNNPESAARAYDTAAVHIFGKFALTNKMMGLLK